MESYISFKAGQIVKAININENASFLEYLLVMKRFISAFNLRYAVGS